MRINISTNSLSVSYAEHLSWMKTLASSATLVNFQNTGHFH